MKRRLKVLMTLLLSASMAFGNMGVTAYASESVSSTEIIQEEIGTDFSEEVQEIAASEENTEKTESEQSKDSTDDADSVKTTSVSTADAKIDETTTATIVSFTYDGKPHKCSDDSSINLTGWFRSISENGLSEPTQVEPTRTEAGTTEVRLFTTEDDAKKDQNYSLYLLKVKPIEITVESQTLYKEYDGTPLSNNDSSYTTTGSYINNDHFKAVFNASITDPGSVENTFTMEAENDTSLSSNYSFNKIYGRLIVTASRNAVNDLATPKNVKATVLTNGSVKLTWKAVKTYKSGGSRQKATYYVYRYNDNGTWDLLADRVLKTTFTDAKSSDGETLIYKIIAYGVDASGVKGECETPAYIQAAPRIISATTKKSKTNINVQFVATSGKKGTYTLQHWDTKKKKVTDEIDVTSDKVTKGTYKSKNGKRTLSVNNYVDYGASNVTVSGMNNHTFGFRVRANEVSVIDYGKTVTVPETRWTVATKCKLEATAPTLTGEADSKTKIHFSWTKVKSATGYQIEYSTDKTFATGVTSVFCDKNTKKSLFSTRKLTLNDVTLGVPVYAKVTAYKKGKNDGSTMGTALDTSDTVMTYGRQGKVKNLEAIFYEDGGQRSDAKLTWSDEESGIVGYYVVRDVYSYSSQTKKYDSHVSTTVLQDYKSGNKTKHWASTNEKTIENGNLIKYTVQSVYKTDQTVNLKLGENQDGYILSEPASYYYMNPTEISFKSSTVYKVGVGNTTATTLEFKPKKQPTTMDDLSKADFKEVYLFNKDVDYALYCDDLTATQLKKYITVDSDGKIKGIKATGSHNVYLTASSKSDPNNVYDEIEVKVTTSSSDGSDDDNSGKTDGLVVCLDAGHGGTDAGTKGDLNGTTYYEKAVNLALAKKVGNILSNKYGATVYYTRKDDSYVSLTGRTDIAKNKGCNLFVSLHCDYSDSSSSKGTKVYYSVKKQYAAPKLAAAISSGVSSTMSTENDGAKTREGDNGDYYSVIRTSAAKGIPGLIVEHGFMSNSSDLNQLINNQDAIAEAEAKAIANYWNKD